MLRLGLLPSAPHASESARVQKEHQRVRDGGGRGELFPFRHRLVRGRREHESGQQRGAVRCGCCLVAPRVVAGDGVGECTAEGVSSFAAYEDPAPGAELAVVRCRGRCLEEVMEFLVAGPGSLRRGSLRRLSTAVITSMIVS